MFEWLFTVEGWVSLATLTMLELVLGIDNLVILAIAAGRLPPEQRPLARRIGLIGALILRIAMLFMLVWITKMREPLFHVGDFAVSWRDIILLVGGVFLLWKATMEVHQEVEGEDTESKDQPKATSFLGVVMIIMVIDFIFALDSIITAVAMTDWIEVMIAANVIAIVMMLVSANSIAGFIERHPTVKMLALSFILLIGVALVADGLHFHIPREYIYFAIAFSLAVEFLNSLVRRKKSADH